MVRPSIEARVTAKHKKEKEQESFYINPSQLAGGGPKEIDDDSQMMT